MYVKSEIWLCAFGVLVAILLRCATSLHPYSGHGKPPMFGDYEAQRHWMEITVNLPIREWYQNTTKNDLQYWGLDYPPLTAYHSYLCGLVASFINSDYVALHKSRGYESEHHKLFMRYSVLFVDLLVYIPAIVCYFFCTKARKTKERQISTSVAVVLALFYPGVILIDHGHFQYNCVSLGLTVVAITFISVQKNVMGSIFFCLALNYKQMELYHSLPFFVFLLSTCVPKPGQGYLDGFKLLVKIGLSVLATFALIWLPFLFDRNDSLQVLHRLFPVSRGVFEDKVANLWCSVNSFYKLKAHFNNAQMVRYCTIATLLAVLPSSADLFLRPNVQKFVPALINSSLAFFLFSFQVHEKSILIAAIPALLSFRAEPFASFWFLVASVFSMFPLFVKDELVVAFVALTTLYVAVFHISLEYGGRKERLTFVNNFRVLLNARITKNGDIFRNLKNHRAVLFDLLKYVAVCVSLSGYLVLILVSLIFKPPERYPDVFPLLVSAYSCIHFLGFFVYFNIVQFKIPQAAEDTRYIKLKSI